MPNENSSRALETTGVLPISSKGWEKVAVLLMDERKQLQETIGALGLNEQRGINQAAEKMAEIGRLHRELKEAELNGRINETLEELAINQRQLITAQATTITNMAKAVEPFLPDCVPLTWVNGEERYSIVVTKGQVKQLANLHTEVTMKWEVATRVIDESKPNLFQSIVEKRLSPEYQEGYSDGICHAVVVVGETVIAEPLRQCVINRIEKLDDDFFPEPKDA